MYSKLKMMIVYPNLKIMIAFYIEDNNCPDMAGCSNEMGGMLK